METKQKLSDARKNKHTGENNSFYGKHHTEEKLNKKYVKKIVETFHQIILK